MNTEKNNMIAAIAVLEDRIAKTQDMIDALPISSGVREDMESVLDYLVADRDDLATRLRRLK